ncbi:hypothetical protein B0T26DRAFT_738329 [Lasiosphaeria miniovina]|uniref:WSC domain-containing protein n=1 Tax=Lasiosphaeria miniovina TaxID=1954250 RepID=A0AA40E8C3_9PEZI|nr:uncharacterized protein B0T26DRAFT_738329 [Lasiosphaeria miniovina]KAK0727746.1 hypothetical protein B0T26DRAFT_738329 [Lasiosphaeria miniovina]
MPSSLLFGLAASLSLAVPAYAGFQVQCFSRLFDERLDPIVNPGKLSGHVHVISGGNGFAAAMDFDRARASSCTTCNVRDDLSNYWTPKMYFHAQNGSFLPVPVVGDNQYGNMGGMVIYYNDNRGDVPTDTIHPFPPNFRMLAGNPFKRSATADEAGQAVHMKCLGDGGNVNYPGFPPRKCSGGIRAEVVMPSCWDGVNVDSPDHKSHVAYPVGAVEGGRCPPTHPKRLFSMFYEVTYSTEVFQDMWPDGGSGQPFVLSSGDPVGTGFHADFLNGWDVAVLANAAASCQNTLTPNGNRCQPDYAGADKVLRHMTDQGEAFACKLPSVSGERPNDVLGALLGCNPLTDTEAAARAVSCGGAQKPGGTASTTLANVPLPGGGSFTDTTPLNFSYIGCAADDPAARTFAGSKWVALADMTVPKCLAFCRSNSYAFAGVEWGSECFCGNALPAGRAPVPGAVNKCVKPCNGDSKQTCGGGGAMSLYKACGAAQECVNQPVLRRRRGFLFA